MALEAIDLFCGAGGLTHGLRRAGIKVKTGVDLDPACEFPLTANNPGTKFIQSDLASVKGEALMGHWSKRSVRILAGCAPCQPFSPYTRKQPGPLVNGEWGLLDHFSRLIAETKPDIVTMENVPSLKGHEVYLRFLDTLQNNQYCVSARIAACAEYGIPQSRRRLVLLASRFGPIRLLEATHSVKDVATVRDAIGSLPRLRAGEESSRDRLHKARALTPINLKRIKAARPGGTWADWPKELLAPCHRKKSGKSFKSVYARMVWDEPAPTITTSAFNFGTGRFGHPQQHRGLTLREAAILQSFPRHYRFVEPSEPVTFVSVGRLIGNAVPVRLGEVIGRSIVYHVNSVKRAKPRK